MSEELFRVLADDERSPADRIRALAVSARVSLGVEYILIRLDTVGEYSEGDAPADGATDDMHRLVLGPAARPIGELVVSPWPASGPETDLAPYSRCAELIHRLQAGYLDTLTGLYNRRRLEMEFTGVSMSNDPVSVVMMDIDHFKHVNDTHGHDAGDAVLREFASRLSRELPEGGFLARYGGEEFCLMFRGMREPAAAEAAESMRSAVSAAPIRHRNTEIRVTSSAGVASGAGARIVDVMRSADQALYAAKTRGRNQTVTASASRDAGRPGSGARQKIVWPRPLHDLAWFGRRVIGLDRSIRRLVIIDAFGGAVPTGPELPDVLSFARLGRKTIVVPSGETGIAVMSASKGSVKFSRICGPKEDAPAYRRVVADGQQKRVYAIELDGSAVHVTDADFGGLQKIPAAFESPPACVTSVLALGKSLLILDALGRRVEIRDRVNLKVKRHWTLPKSGYELFLCYLAEKKCVMAGGAGGMRLIGSDGRVREERDEPVLSAYDHPEVGWVMSTPEGTVVVK